MVFSNEATKTVIEKFPDLQRSEDWADNYLILEKNYKESLRFSRLMMVLCFYVSDILNQTYISTKKQRELKEIFLLAEFFLNDGDHHVRSAVATCFLEGLINFISHNRITSEKLMPYLVGKESIEYCKAWDKFTGVKTKGLWD